MGMIARKMPVPLGKLGPQLGSIGKHHHQLSLAGSAGLCGQKNQILSPADYRYVSFEAEDCESGIAVRHPTNYTDATAGYI